MSDSAPIGIIGGSGLYAMDEVQVREEVTVDTSFGSPSDKLIVGTLRGHPVVFLPRHGRGHLIPPSQLNFRANIMAMKLLGVERIIAVSAVGSLREEIEPGHMVVIDQFFDRTKARISTFFDEGIVAHITFASPVCDHLRGALIEGCQNSELTVHPQGTYLCMEGPQFSTKAESNVYRQWGMDVIGMTNLQEAKLAREAELCYATLALSTDYDCWHEEHDAVTVEQVIATLQRNVSHAQKVLAEVIPALGAQERTCSCGSALKNAIISDRKALTPEVQERLRPLLEKYL